MNVTAETHTNSKKDNHTGEREYHQGRGTRPTTTPRSLRTVVAGAVNWRMYWIIVVATFAGIAAGQPYIIAISGPQFTVQNAITGALANGMISLVAVFIGLFLSGKVGLRMPYFEAIGNSETIGHSDVTGDTRAVGNAKTIGNTRSIGDAETVEDRASSDSRLTRKQIKGLWLTPPLVGVVSAGTIVLFEQLFAATFPETMAAFAESVQTVRPGPAASIGAILYGGIFEEVQLRLFILTSLLWVMATVRRLFPGPSTATKPSKTLAWIAIIASAALFALGHVATMATTGYAEPVILARTLVLNIVPGVLFGWLYVSSGLLPAMIAHGTADLVVHVLVPLATGLF